VLSSSLSLPTGFSWNYLGHKLFIYDHFRNICFLAEDLLFSWLFLYHHRKSKLNTLICVFGLFAVHSVLANLTAQCLTDPWCQHKWNILCGTILVGSLVVSSKSPQKTQHGFGRRFICWWWACNSGPCCECRWLSDAIHNPASILSIATSKSQKHKSAYRKLDFAIYSVVE
jgi:hypothetical protein